MARKSKYIREIIDDYCVIDLETTGLSFDFDEIIEIGILKVKSNQIIEQYSQLINPGYSIDPFITELTGITNEMLTNQPKIEDVKEKVLSLIANDVILGHNTSFDLNFLEYGFDIELENPHMDTLQFSRKLYPELDHHRLSDMVSFLNLSNNEHRALSDCISTKQLYDKIKEKMDEDNLKISDLFHTSNSKKVIDNIVASNTEIDEDNFFYNKHCVFTGVLEKMIRKDAMQLVVNCGGILDKSVTKKTNYLILGNNDYCTALKGGKSSKHKKAEKLKLEGQDIEILDENTFYKLLEL